jgi:hypothetical protein
MRVSEQDGARGGEYYFVDLPDGRRMAVSRKRGDNRVWLGRPDDPKSWDQQRGGVGTIDKLLNEWLARIALDAEAADLYWALSALQSSKRA